MSGIARTPGFDFPSGYTAYQFVFVVMQAAAFNGIFTGFGLALDFESGFADRLLLATPRRSALILGYTMSAAIRASIAISILFVLALLVGTNFDGSAFELLALAGLAVLLAVALVLWSCGVAMRFRSIQAAPLIQVPFFLALFMTPVFAPLELLSGWIKDVATYNPVTYFLQAGRGFISGNPTSTDIAFSAMAAMIAVFSLWAFRSLRAAERAA
jgi:ABC-2 type transport system permease protein